MGSLSSDPTSLTTSKLKPQNQVNRQVRVDAVIGKKGEGVEGRLEEEERPYFMDRVFLKFRAHTPLWMRASNAMEKARARQCQAGEGRAWAAPGDTSFSSLCPAHTHFIIAAAAARASWVFRGSGCRGGNELPHMPQPQQAVLGTRSGRGTWLRRMGI